MMKNYRAVKNKDGSYHYRGHHIKKGDWNAIGKKNKVTWSYQDSRTGLWRTASTLKLCKTAIDKFIDFYNYKEKESKNDRRNEVKISNSNET